MKGKKAVNQNLKLTLLTSAILIKIDENLKETWQKVDFYVK